MALEIKEVERSFVFGDQKISDPNPSLPVDSVINLLSSSYPELVNANLKGPVVKDGVATYTLSNELKSKG